MKKLISTSGFTLLEIMISMAILSISLLALYSSMGNSLRASGIAEEMSLAMQLGRQKMAEVNMTLETDIARGAFPDDKEEHGTFDKPYDRFHWAYAIRKVEIPVVNPPGDAGGGAGGGAGGSGGSSGGTPNPANQTSGDIAGAASNMASIVSKKISEAIRELKVTISWGPEGTPEDELEKVVLTTHLVKLR